jgi:PAN domain
VAPSGSNTDLAALQERLRKLEEEARRREAAPGPSAPPATAALPPVTPRTGPGRSVPEFKLDENVRLEGLKLSDKREPNPAACREACESESGCIAFQHGRRAPVMGQCQLFARVDARQEDSSWRSGVRTDAPSPPGPLARTGAPGLSVKISAKLSRKERGFDIYEGVSVMGEQLKMSATDSHAGCQAICMNTPGCAAATYNDFFRGKNVACLVYRDVTDLMKAPTSTLMVRTD